MNGMSTHVDFAQRLAIWHVEVSDLVEVLTCHQILTTMRFDAPVGPLRAALQAGEITSDNLASAVEDAAAKIAALDRASSIIAELDFPLTVRFSDAVQANADSIVEQLQPHFDANAERLTSASRVLPVDSTAESVLGSGPDAASAWHSLAQAALGLDSIADVRIRLEKYGYGDTSGNRVAAFVADVDKDALIATNLAFRGLDRDGRPLTPCQGGNWRRLVDAGHTLRLNSEVEARTVHLSSVAA